VQLRSGSPFWLLKDGIVDAYPLLKRDERCDVAVVGGGITGALVAHEMAAAGVDVVLLERGDVAAASTAASTSLLQYEVDVELPELIARVGETNAVRALRLGLEAIDAIEAITNEDGADCGFARRASWYLAANRWRVPRLKRGYRALRDHGFDVEYLDRREVAARSTVGAAGAIVSQGDAEIDAVRFTHRLLQRAIARGARVYERTEMLRFDREGRRLLLRTTRGATVHAGSMVFATGYDSEQYTGRRVGRLHSTYAMVSEPVDNFDGWPERALIWENSRPYHYLRTTPDGRAIIGGGDIPWKNARVRNARLESKSAALEKRFHELFPCITFDPAYAWAGTFGESDDGLPYIGPCANCPGAYFALGYGGNGITFSMIAARILTDLHAGRANRDAAMFSFAR
jgi:glycine/D-amino acid oxidase-like deaminating enzyme